MSGDAMAPEVTWEETLDELERCLHHQRQALDAGRLEDFPRFRASSELDLLPEHLAVRAQRLLAQAQALQAELSAALEACGRDLVEARQPRRRNDSTPSFLDARA